MSYEEFKAQMASIVVGNSENFWHYLINNPVFALIAGAGFIAGAIPLIAHAIPEKTAAYSTVLKSHRDSAELTEFSGGAAGVAAVLLLFTTLILALVHSEKPEKTYSKQEADRVFSAYMESLPDLKLRVAAYELSADKQRNVSSSEYEGRTTYIYDNAVCQNCQKRTVMFKSEEGKDKKYIKAEMLVSYSLAKGEAAYVKTKPPLREAVLDYGQGAYYNPILYVSQSEGGIAE